MQQKPSVIEYVVDGFVDCVVAGANIAESLVRVPSSIRVSRQPARRVTLS